MRDYLVRHELPETRYSTNLQGTGFANPIRENPRSINIDINKSVYLQISSVLEVKIPNLSGASPSDVQNRSTDWAIRVAVINDLIEGHLLVFELKNVRSGQIRTGVFVAGGIPSLEHMQSNYIRTVLQQVSHASLAWVRFSLAHEVSFEDFDSTKVRLDGDPQLEYFMEVTSGDIISRYRTPRRFTLDRCWRLAPIEPTLTT